MVTYFPCDKCDERFDDQEKIKSHFTNTHIPDKVVECSLDECEFSSKTINVLIMHIGVHHLDIVKDKVVKCHQFL